jgi:hypothetical protein
MANSPNPVDDFMHRLSVDIFGEDIVDNTNPLQYYPQSQACVCSLLRVLAEPDSTSC